MDLLVVAQKLRLEHLRLGHLHEYDIKTIPDFLDEFPNVAKALLLVPPKQIEYAKEKVLMAIETKP
jgi:hypothetical protein